MKRGNEISKSWTMVPLEQLVTEPRSIAYGVLKPGPYDSTGVPLLRIKDLKDFGIAQTELHYITDELDEEFKRTRLEGGEVLISIQGTIGRVAIVPKRLAGSNISRTLAVIRPRDPNDTRWIMYGLRAPQSIAQFEKVITGSTRDSLNLADLRQVRLPIAPPQTRDRIVAELEKQFSRLDEAVANIKRVKANLKRYKASVLKAAVEGKLAPPAGPWKQVALGDITTSIRNGYSKKPDAEQGTRIFRISAVRPMKLDANDVRYLSRTPADYEPYLVEPEDVLFTRYNGSRDYVGVCARVPANLPPTVYPDKLIRVRVPSSILLPEFLVILASTGHAREYVESKIRTTAGQSGISGGDLKSLPLELPCVGEQHRIVAEVERRLSVIEELEVTVVANLTRADRLRQSILHQAFSGQLACLQRSKAHASLMRESRQTGLGTKLMT